MSFNTSDPSDSRNKTLIFTNAINDTGAVAPLSLTVPRAYFEPQWGNTILDETANNTSVKHMIIVTEPTDPHYNNGNRFTFTNSQLYTGVANPTISVNIRWPNNDNSNANGVISNERKFRIFVDQTPIPVSNFLTFDWSSNPQISFSYPGTLSAGTHIIWYYMYSDEGKAATVDNLDPAAVSPYEFHGVTFNSFSVLVPPPIPLTPLYLGNATVTNTGDFYLAGTVMTTNRFPVSKHELAPRAYVDSYIKSVTDYYDAILDPNGGLTGLLDRVSYLEAQLERVYQVLWSQSRDVSAIVTAHAGAIVADYATAEAPNPALIANHPAEPTPQNILNFSPV